MLLHMRNRIGQRVCMRVFGIILLGRVAARGHIVHQEQQQGAAQQRQRLCSKGSHACCRALPHEHCKRQRNACRKRSSSSRHCLGVRIWSCMCRESVCSRCSIKQANLERCFGCVPAAAVVNSCEPWCCFQRLRLRLASTPDAALPASSKPPTLKPCTRVNMYDVE